MALIVFGSPRERFLQEEVRFIQEIATLLNLCMSTIGLYAVCGELGWVGFRVGCFRYKTNPNPHEKIFAVGKSGPIATFNLFFLGLGWPWVGEFVGFIIILTCFPTQQNLVKSQAP